MDRIPDLSIGREMLFGGLEAGGTKVVCAVGTSPEDMRAEIRFPTTTPYRVVSKAVEFFHQYKLAAVGLASFGPLDLEPASPTYGYIRSTPKIGWSQTNLLGMFKQSLDLPIILDTDVNAAAFGEFSWDLQNHGLASLVYFTIGTGIGAGIITNGRILHGMLHPEVGHMRIPHDKDRDPFSGICPFHHDCFEGLASGSALAARWGQPAEELPIDHPAWILESEYIASALVNTILIFSPQRILLGGGVMNREYLFPLIRQRTRELLNDYLDSPVLAGNLDAYIIPPPLGHQAGVLGAIALARSLFSSREQQCVSQK